MHELQVKYQAAIRQLVDACHRGAELNFVTSAGGNLSQRVDENVLIGADHGDRPALAGAV